MLIQLPPGAQLTFCQHFRAVASTSQLEGFAENMQASVLTAACMRASRKCNTAEIALASSRVECVSAPALRAICAHISRSRRPACASVHGRASYQTAKWGLQCSALPGLCALAPPVTALMRRAAAAAMLRACVSFGLLAVIRAPAYWPDSRLGNLVCASSMRMRLAWQQIGPEDKLLGRSVFEMVKYAVFVTSSAVVVSFNTIVRAQCVLELLGRVVGMPAQLCLLLSGSRSELVSMGKPSLQLSARALHEQRAIVLRDLPNSVFTSCQQKLEGLDLPSAPRCGPSDVAAVRLGACGRQRDKQVLLGRAAPCALPIHCAEFEFMLPPQLAFLRGVSARDSATKAPLAQLRALALPGNCALASSATFAACLGGLPRLTRLDMRDCELTQWQGVLQQLSNLHELRDVRLSGNSARLAEVVRVAEELALSEASGGITQLLLPDHDGDVERGDGLPHVHDVRGKLKRLHHWLARLPRLVCGMLLADVLARHDDVFRCTHAGKVSRSAMAALARLRCVHLELVYPARVPGVVSVLRCNVTALTISALVTHPACSALRAPNRQDSCAVQAGVLLTCTRLRILALGSGVVDAETVSALIVRLHSLRELHTLCLGDGGMQQVYGFDADLHEAATAAKRSQFARDNAGSVGVPASALQYVFVNTPITPIPADVCASGALAHVQHLECGGSVDPCAWWQAMGQPPLRRLRCSTEFVAVPAAVLDFSRCPTLRDTRERLDVAAAAAMAAAMALHPRPHWLLMRQCNIDCAFAALLERNLVATLPLLPQVRSSSDSMRTHTCLLHMCSLAFKMSTTGCKS